jgi:hypothetical protein
VDCPGGSQQKLGLLPERRTWIRIARGDCPSTHGTHLIVNTWIVNENSLVLQGSGAMYLTLSFAMCNEQPARG